MQLVLHKHNSIAAWGSPEVTLPGQRTATRWWMATGITVLVAGLVRVVYLVWLCPFDLAPDEAYYWDWSRQLDWCYYSKGPLVAWLIRAADVCCGSWLLDQQGTKMPAVRLPAVICGQLLALGCFCLTWRVSGSPKLAYLTMLALMLAPHHSVISTLITIDSPFLCCWQWALVFAWHALGMRRLTEPPMFGGTPLDGQVRECFLPGPITHGTTLAWFGLGLITGLGILAKPTMVLFPFCLVLFLSAAFATAGPKVTDFVAERGMLLKRLAVMLTVAFVVGAGPILYWNAQHDWVTFRHVFRQASLTGSRSWRWWGMFEYIGVQTALLFGAGMLAWLAATWFVLSDKKRIRLGLSWPVGLFLLSFSWPVFAVFAGFSLRTPIQPNWPAPAYLAAVPLVAVWLAHVSKPCESWSRSVRVLLVISTLLAVAITLTLHRPDIAYRTGLLPAIAGWLGQTDKDLWPRRFDPTCRLQGWRELALHVHQWRQTLRQQGEEPIVVATWYGLAAELAFYLPDQPRVYCISLASELRFSQYDLWRPNPLADPERFAGKTFLCVGPLSQSAQSGFASVQSGPAVVIQRYGYTIAREWIFVGQQFHGFPPSDKPPSY
jgi:4-amino-4-deoxy-L-arabinose transferase-like glycosyltransferase